MYIVHVQIVNHVNMERLQRASLFVQQAIVSLETTERAK